MPEENQAIIPTAVEATTTLEVRPSPSPGQTALAVTPATALQKVRRTKPEVLLPGDDMPLSVVAAELGRHLKGSGLFVFRNAVGTFTGTPLVFTQMRDQRFRTFAERHVHFVCQRSGEGGGKKTVVQSMSLDVAQAILCADQFIDQLPQITRILPCQLPVCDPNGTIRLSPPGHDPATGFYTLPSPPVDDDMALDDARAVIRELLSEFPFVDKKQGLAVAVAAMINLFCAVLLADGCLRPVFLIVANAEGAGKSLLCSAAITPVLGFTPVGAKPDREDELMKRITTLVKTGLIVLFLDNLKKNLDSPTLEAFTTSSYWSDRQLGSNNMVSGTHNVSVYITGNGLVITPDLKRRALSVELRLEHEKPEDRDFKRTLTDTTLKEMRPKILSAMWTIVKDWFASGCPPPSQSHNSFVEWAATVAGIVEHSGFGNCLAPSDIGTPLDRDTDDVRRLVQAMAAQAKRFKFEEVCALAVELGCFEWIFGISSGEPLHDLDGEGFHLPHLDRRQNSQFGRLLKRYENRLFGDLRFAAEGVGHPRRYFVLKCSQETSSTSENTQEAAPTP